MRCGGGWGGDTTAHFLRPDLAGFSISASQTLDCPDSAGKHPLGGVLPFSEPSHARSVSHKHLVTPRTLRMTYSYLDDVADVYGTILSHTSGCSTA